MSSQKEKKKVMGLVIGINSFVSKFIGSKSTPPPTLYRELNSKSGVLPFTTYVIHLLCAQSPHLRNGIINNVHNSWIARGGIQ